MQYFLSFRLYRFLIIIFLFFALRVSTFFLRCSSHRKSFHSFFFVVALITNLATHSPATFLFLHTRGCISRGVHSDKVLIHLLLAKTHSTTLSIPLLTFPRRRWGGREALLPSLCGRKMKNTFYLFFLYASASIFSWKFASVLHHLNTHNKKLESN